MTNSECILLFFNVIGLILLLVMNRQWSNECKAMNRGWYEICKKLINKKLIKENSNEDSSRGWIEEHK